ncbi:hypothetical protein [Palleronia sp.]|uniref:hypothetical protein n=1 Tax=Palleronia sp. TaxID=1940284 RepID=UPI0035C7DB92
MIRGEALAQILRWREAAVGLGAVAVGLWWAVGSYGVMRWVGIVIAIGGAAILREAVVRLRRPRDGGGAGMVNVTERQITYLSGTGGGAVSADTLAQVAIHRSGTGAPVWHLADTQGRRIAVPADAEGAGALFDALAALPRFDEGAAVEALKDPAPGARVLWTGAPDRLS